MFLLLSSTAVAVAYVIVLYYFINEIPLSSHIFTKIDIALYHSEISYVLKIFAYRRDTDGDYINKITKLKQ